jgi:hypothetical protein
MRVYLFFLEIFGARAFVRFRNKGSTYLAVVGCAKRPNREESAPKESTRCEYHDHLFLQSIRARRACFICSVHFNEIFSDIKFQVERDSFDNS